ncbi:hypothetical protein TNCV_4443731 [Trichonephila clavipes]|nr:hypothetical protein TNCV_4443731 [Trichonephila clavipes]
MDIGIAAPITCAALDAQPSTPPFGVVRRTVHDEGLNGLRHRCQAGLQSRTKAATIRCLYHSATAASRLEWCRARETGLQQSRFNLNSDNNRVLVGCPRGERLNPAFALQRLTGPHQFEPRSSDEKDT